MPYNVEPSGGGSYKPQIRKIMEAEAQPLRALETRKGREEAKLKLFQEFKGKFAGVDKAIDEISSFKRLRELKADLGDGATSMSVTVDKDKAAPGSYEIEIEELAARSSVMSNGFSDPNEKALGIGFITMTLPNGDEPEIFVDEDHSSLNGVANLINSQTNFPIRASVIRDAANPETAWRLILSAKGDGKESQIHIPDFYFLDGERDLYIDGNRDAKNALIKVDGFEVEAESNTIKDFLPGVNLQLKQAKPGQTFNLTITEDLQKISGKVKGLVEQLNSILQFINKQNQIDQSSDTRSTFAGDTGLQSIEFRLRNMMHEGFGVGEPDSNEFKIFFMSDIGVEFDKTGTITFKEEKFQKFMEKDFESLSQIITGDFGFAFQMRELMAGFTRAGGGMLNLREQGLKTRIKQIDDQIDMKTRQLDRRKQSLVDQFSKLEASMAAMQQQQQYLSATLGGGGGQNPIAQLMGG